MQLNIHFTDEENKHYVHCCEYVHFAFGSVEHTDNPAFMLTLRIPDMLVCYDRDNNVTAKLQMRYVVGICPSNINPHSFNY